MNKKILIWINILAWIITAFLYFSGDDCGSACDTHSFLNPLGLKEGPELICIALCVYTPNPLFYLSTDLSIILLLASLVYGLKKGD
ncbi:hypothetical protein KJ780_03300 [Candidatus Micrarchaeota archaeon]|nr:hypothetical protein [Candidatus Micrarchaeota archaeon]